MAIDPSCPAAGARTDMMSCVDLAARPTCGLFPFRWTPQQRPQQVIMRVGMAAMLAEGFGVFDVDFPTAPATPAGLHLEVFVDAVLTEQPVALAFVAGEHRSFL